MSAQEALKDSVYTVKFSDIAGTTTADAVINFPSRSGRLVVSTPEEGDLQAKFSVETYMNRAQFTNLSSENAKTFEWNFGDGATSTERNPMHSYAEAGTYTVRLTARGIVKTVTAEQQIIINPANTWSASGDYRLDPTVNSARAFKSMHEMLSLLSQCTPDGTINVKTGGKEAFDANLQSADSLALLSTLTEKLGKAGVVMAFKNEAQNPITLCFNAEGYRLLPPYLARQRGGNAQRSRNKHRRNRPLLGADHLFGHKYAARSVHRYKQQRESEGKLDGKCG